MQDNHQTRPELGLEFDLVRAKTWDSIWTEIFSGEYASEPGWHLATSKILEVLDDPSEEGDYLFEKVRGVVANALGAAWALRDAEASNRALDLINDVIGRAVDEIIGLFFPAICCVEGCGHYDGDDPLAQRVWAEWNSLTDDELSPVKTIASTLGLTNAEVAVIVFPPEGYGPWADDHEPMRPWFPTKDVTLVDPSSTVEVGTQVKVGFSGPQGKERLWVRVLDPLDDGSGWVAAVLADAVSLPIERGDLVTFEDRHVLETAAESAAAKQPVAFPVEFVGHVACEDDTIQIGDLVIEDFLGGDPASVWVRKVGDDPDDQSVCEIIIVPYLCDGQYLQEELDAQNAAAAVYPLGRKEYWREKMVGHYRFGIDEHLLTDAEFEEDYWGD